MSALAYRAKKSNGHNEQAMEKFADGLRITPERLQWCRFWVAQEKGEIIGCIALEVLERGRGEVSSFFIAPEHQGRGIGKRLMLALVTIANTQGITQLQEHPDPVSVKHYQRLGFRIEGAKVSRSCTDVEVPYMLRDL